MNADLLYRKGINQSAPCPSCGAVGLSMTGKKNIFEEAGFEGASRKNTFTPLSKDI
ncbi:MAG: hypothetical protein OIN83_09250 [Candidatus Methanoperedens sp.]|nr:hypothetical protein [Candidatus Methanoperedens sp.]